jgi:hypothetical protein
VILNNRTVSKTLKLWFLSWNSTLGVVTCVYESQFIFLQKLGLKKWQHTHKVQNLDFLILLVLTTWECFCTSALQCMHTGKYRENSCISNLTKMPVSTFPALQWTAATFLWSCDSQLSTSVQNGPISSIFGGLWSSNG